MFNENRLIFFALGHKPKAAVAEKKNLKETTQEAKNKIDEIVEKKITKIKPKAVINFAKKIRNKKSSTKLNKKFCVDLLGFNSQTIQKLSSNHTNELVKGVQRTVNKSIPKAKLKIDGYIGEKTLKGLHKKVSEVKFKKPTVGPDPFKAAREVKLAKIRAKAPKAVPAHDTENPLNPNKPLNKPKAAKEKVQEGMDLNADVYDPLNALLKQIKAGTIDKQSLAKANQTISAVMKKYKQYVDLVKPGQNDFLSLQVPSDKAAIHIEIGYTKLTGYHLSLVSNNTTSPLARNDGKMDLVTASMLKPKEKFDANIEIHDPLVRIASLVESGKSENYVTDLKRAIKGMKKLGLKKWDVNSPSNKFKLTLALNNDGRPSLTTKIDGKVVQVSKSKLSSLSAQVRRIRAPKDIAV